MDFSTTNAKLNKQPHLNNNNAALQTNYAYNFNWEFPSQFLQLSENDMEQFFYSGDVCKFQNCEIWQWKTQSEGKSCFTESTSTNLMGKEKQSASMQCVDLIDDLLVDESRQQSKHCSAPYYQPMSNQNIL